MKTQTTILAANDQPDTQTILRQDCGSFRVPDSRSQSNTRDLFPDSTRRSGGFCCVEAAWPHPRRSRVCGQHLYSQQRCWTGLLAWPARWRLPVLCFVCATLRAPAARCQQACL